MSKKEKSVCGGGVRASATGGMLSRGALLTAGIVVAVALILLSPREAVAVPKPHYDVESPNALLKSPNTTAMVQRMHADALRHLELSDCVQAEYWLKGAMELVTSELAELQLQKEMLPILADYGFALICSHRFEEGVEVMLKHVEYTRQLIEGDLLPLAAHHLNALGYAYFQLQDYHKAGHAFELATNVDPGNPNVWSNFAGALMMSGDFEGADGAMEKAFDIVEASEGIVAFNAHQQEALMTNVKILADLKILHDHKWPSSATEVSLPVVDLWYNAVTSEAAVNS